MDWIWINLGCDEQEQTALRGVPPTKRRLRPVRPAAWRPQNVGPKHSFHLTPQSQSCTWRNNPLPPLVINFPPFPPPIISQNFSKNTILDHPQNLYLLVNFPNFAPSQTDFLLTSNPVQTYMLKKKKPDQSKPNQQNASRSFSPLSLTHCRLIIARARLDRDLYNSLYLSFLLLFVFIYNILLVNLKCRPYPFTPKINEFNGKS